MKKIAILVIAALNQEVYKFYIENYWTQFIKYTNIYEPTVDVFLLFSRNLNLDDHEEIRSNIIIDGNSDYNGLISDKQYNDVLPGILSKTIYAFELLKDSYDVFFRTNLSSIININPFKTHVNSNNIIYSGAFCWENSLRKDLIHYEKIGADKSIKSLKELESYRGNTFFSGSGYFLNKQEVNYIINNKKMIRYDIIDDVSIGLMLEDYEKLSNFTITIRKTDTYDQIINKLNKNQIHIRLQHLPVEKAQEIYSLIKYSYTTYLP